MRDWSLRHQVLSLAMWPFLEQVLGFMVSAVDLILAGRMADGELRVAMMDAMGLGGYTAWLLMICQGAIGTGVMALVARATGANDRELTRKGLTQGLLLGFATGCVVALLIWFTLPFLVSAFGLYGESARQAKLYLGTLVWSAPLIGVMFSANNALRGSGDTLTSFLSMVVVNVVNAGLSWLFVLGPNGWGGMGLQGLALGTVLGWGSGAVLLIIYLLFHRRSVDGEDVVLSLRGCRFVPDAEVLRRIVRVGLPQAIEMAGMWMIQAAMVRSISNLPIDGTLGAHMIAIRVESMSFLPGIAIGSAGAALVGQYLGAQNPEMAARASRLCWCYAAIFMGLLGILFLVWPRELVGLIIPPGPDARLFQDLAGPLVFLCGLSQPFLATSLILKTSMRGAGATRLVMPYSFASMILYRVIVVPVGVHFFQLGLTGIWVVMFLDVITQAIIFSRLHFQGKWLTYKV